MDVPYSLAVGIACGENTLVRSYKLRADDESGTVIQIACEVISLVRSDVQRIEFTYPEEAFISKETSKIGRMYNVHQMW